MLRVHRLVAVQICLLIVGVVLVVLLSVTSALATSTHRLNTSSPSRLHETFHAVRASERRLTGRKSSSSQPSKCVPAARASKRHEAVKRCAVEKSKAAGAKPSVRTGTDGSAPASVASVGAQAPVIGAAPHGSTRSARLGTRSTGGISAEHDGHEHDVDIIGEPLNGRATRDLHSEGEPHGGNGSCFVR